MMLSEEKKAPARPNSSRGRQYRYAWECFVVFCPEEAHGGGAISRNIFFFVHMAVKFVLVGSTGGVGSRDFAPFLVKSCLKTLSK